MPRTKQEPVRVLLVDGEGSERDVMEAGLVAAGHSVEAMPVDHSLAKKVAEHQWDVLIFDLAAQEALQNSFDNLSQPIRILLIDLRRPEATLKALQDTCANLWLEKPVHVGVLTASIANLRRRTAQSLSPHAKPRLGEELNVWSLSPTHWTISSPNGKVAKLIRAETDFLLMLGREPGEAVSRDRLIVAMGHQPKAYDYRRLDTFVSRMRNKVFRACSVSLPLRSVHAVGYSFAAPLHLLE